MAVYWDFKCRTCGKDVERSYYEGQCNGCGVDEQQAREAESRAKYERENAAEIAAAPQDTDKCPTCGVGVKYAERHDGRKLNRIVGFACECWRDGEAASIGEAFLNSRPTGV